MNEGVNYSDNYYIELNMMRYQVYLNYWIQILVNLSYLYKIQSPMIFQQRATCSFNPDSFQLLSSPILTDPDAEQSSFYLVNEFNSFIDMITDKNHNELTVIIDRFAFEQLRKVVDEKNMKGSQTLGLIDFLKHYLVYTILKLSGNRQNNEMQKDPMKFGQTFGKQMRNLIDLEGYEEQMWGDLDITAVQNLIETISIDKQSLQSLQKLTKLTTIQFLNELQLYQKVIQFNNIIKSNSENTDEHIYAYELNNIAYAYFNLNLNIEALNYYKISLDIISKLEGDFSTQSISSLLNIATIYQNLGLFEDSLNWYNLILDIKIKADNQQDLQFAFILFCMASTYLKSDLLQLSLAACERALSLIYDIKGLESIDCVPALNVMCSVFYKTKNYQQSLKYASKSLEILLNCSGPDSMEFITLLSNIGSIFYQMNSIQDALVFFGKSLSILQKNYGTHCEEYYFLMQSIKQVHNSINNQTAEDAGVSLAKVLQNIAIFLNNSGKPKQSLGFFSLWISNKTEKEQENHLPDKINSTLRHQISLINTRCWDEKQPIIFVLLAVMYRKMGKYSQSIEFYKKSLIAHERVKKVEPLGEENSISIESDSGKQLQQSKETLLTQTSSESLFSNVEESYIKRDMDKSINNEETLNNSYYSEETQMML